MADDRRSLSGEFSPFSSDLFDLVQDLSGVVWEFSFAANRFTFVSAHAEALTGWPAHQWTDFDSWVAMIHPDDRMAAVDFCRRESSAGHDHDFEYRTVHPDGRVSWVRDVVRPVLDDAGTLTHLRGIMLDVSERRRAFERRQRAVEDWEHLAQINQAIAEDRPPDEVFAVIAHATAAAVGADTSSVGQLSGDGIVIRGLSWPAGRRVGDHLSLPDHALLWSALRSGRAVRVDSAQLADADQDPLLAEIRAEGLVSVVIAPVSVAGRPWGFLAVSNRERDLPVGVEARMERFARSAAVGVTHADTRARLVHRANTDPLTGLGTHRAFQDRLREESERARRERRPLSLARIDLDQFKPLNDSYGYEAGDRVLADLAQRLSALTGPHDMLARVSGDEFAWILPGVDPERAFALAERARTAISGGEWLPGVFGSASAGVCGFRPDGRSR
ncbi:MAG TPA: diguanylate cyclase [Miltoncostaeaceae bacterium]|nr:diguanylate cyclase [Miltoncostaeaceae bacterium]